MGSFYKTFLILTPFLLVISCGPNPVKKDHIEQSQSDSNDPELQMTKLDLKSFGEKTLEWELHSPLAKAYTTKNFMETKDLEVQLYSNGKKGTKIYSDSGILITEKSGDLSQVPVVHNVDGRPLNQGDMYLKGHVVVISTDGAKLETDWLWFHQNDQLITSTAPVKVTRPDSITKGVGLKADSDLSSVTIYKQTLVIRSTETKHENN